MHISYDDYAQKHVVYDDNGRRMGQFDTHGQAMELLRDMQANVCDGSEGCLNCGS